MASPESKDPDKAPPVVPEELAQFVGALFDPRDVIGIRPIESWIEGGRTYNRVLYRQIKYGRTRFFASNGSYWRWLLDLAERESANLYFTVCPRVGPSSRGETKRYDLAWQIRVVRVLWADLDHCTPEEALGRCQAAGLPSPSVVVRSGNGVHLYWILSEPYLIDDAEEPPGIYTEFIDQGPNKKKLTRKLYYTREREPVYLYLRDPKTGGDTKTPNPDCPWGELSPKARHVQDVLAGLAAKIGGDHTTDLARLLRLPCTLNRKNQRNGKEPVPCMVVDCRPECRYAFADFEELAALSPQKTKREKIAAIQLPTGRKLATSAKRADRFRNLINACLLAEPGQRSERDFHLCAWCVEQGVSAEEVWDAVQGIGKFVEKERPYFDRTWRKAQEKTRLKIYERAVKRSESPPSRNGVCSSATMGGPDQSPPVVGGLPPPEEGDDEGGGEENPVCVPEALDDPHALARAWVLLRGSREQPGDCLAYYRQQFWQWQECRWCAVPDHELDARLTRFVRQQLENALRDRSSDGDGEGEREDTIPPVTRKLIADVRGALAGEILVPETVPQPSWRGDNPGPRNWIALRNGLLDVDALLAGAQDVLRPHTPLWFSPCCLPFPFDPTADCPTWRAFLARNFGDDPAKATLLQQWAGYLLLPDTTLQRFLMMVGEGKNGKSVVCEVVTALLGEDNVSTVPLELFGDKFRLVNTLGKLANITAEVGELDKMAEGQLKAFVVGDPMDFERKFKQPFTARPTARLMLATNNAPQFADKSEGIWRRVLLLPFSVQIPDGERIAGMDKREFWQKSGELPGILNWALAGLHALRVQKDFVVPASCREASERLRVESNPAKRFLLDHYQSGDGEVVKAALYQEYVEWCRNHGHHALAEVGFGKEVKRAFPAVKDGKMLSHATGRRGNSYAGLCARPDD
jgi:P4 family phage/plasmid primase-like protien